MEFAFENRPRARDIGIKIGIMPTGESNSICDILELRVGHVTLMQGDGKLIKGKGPIRTGVTAIIPADDISPSRKLPAAVDVINGFGKSVGTIQINELGEIGKANLPGYIGFFQFMRNHCKLNAFEQSEMILHAILNPDIANRAKNGDFVKQLDHFQLLHFITN